MPFLIECRYTQSINNLSTFSADGSSSFMIVLLAVWETLIFEELFVGEWFAAFGAGEVISVPVFIKSRDCSTIGDGLMAFSTGESKELIIVLMAICIIVFLVEFTIREWCITNRAVEAFLMEILVQCLQVFSLDFFSATRAFWQEGGFVAIFAICFVIFDIEFFSSNFLCAFFTYKAIHVE